ncbi:DUF397 domain-containing protein [Streptomyces longwoodensis]|uniref:DUF397 domain-containing protein n=1 Tax=Streptomyces longwoodensis TaxID=68231 RepID=UPI0030E3FCD0
MSDRLVWRKSSHSNSEGGNCVEVALTPAVAHIRDSKTPAGPSLAVPARTWKAFVAALRPSG